MPLLMALCRMERTELEPINSYYRLLVHRIARYYGVEHTIESARPAVLLLSKTLETKMYQITLIEPCDTYSRIFIGR